MLARIPDHQHLDDLVLISRQLGKNVGYVQGAGGNTSLKVGHQAMFIKASGVALAYVENIEYFMAVDAARLAGKVLSCQNETEYGHLMNASLLDDKSGRRPSIETGFHALLGPCVLHTHSVWVNVLSCSLEGRDILRDIWPEAIWVPYATPGLALTKEVAKRSRGSENSVLVLQNHGLIVAGQTPAEARDLHDNFNLAVRQALSLDERFPWFGLTAAEASDVKDLLFPDQAVFSVDSALAKSESGVQTRLAAQYIAAAVVHCGLTLRFLEPSERDVLLGLESEKYRQRVAKA